MTRDDALDIELRSSMARSATRAPDDLLLRVMREVDVMSQRTRPWPTSWFATSHATAWALAAAAVTILAIAGGMLFLNLSPPVGGPKASATATPAQTTAPTDVSNGLLLRQIVYLPGASAGTWAVVKNTTAEPASYYVEVPSSDGQPGTEGVGVVQDLLPGEQRAVRLSTFAGGSGLPSAFKATIRHPDPTMIALRRTIALSVTFVPVGAGDPILDVVVTSTGGDVHFVFLQVMLFRDGELIGLVAGPGVETLVGPSRPATLHLGDWPVTGTAAGADTAVPQIDAVFKVLGN